MIDESTWFIFCTGSIAAGILFAGFLIIFKQYVQKHYRSSLYLAIAWFGFFLEAAFSSIRLLCEDVQIMLFFQKLSLIGLAPGFLGIVATTDSISRDDIDSRRFSVIVFLLGVNSLLLLMAPNEASIKIPNYIVIGIGIVISNALLVLYIRIYQHVPKHLKRLAFINIIGAFFIAVLYVLLRIAEIVFPHVIPPVARIFESVGALIQAFIFAKHEQLFYILPFKVQRLIVYDTHNGISLFVHDWSKEEELIDEDLFSSILHGMGLIVNESIQKGHVQEIKMERGVLLISHGNVLPIAFVIIASKSSQVLNQALGAFRRKFVQRFESSLGGKEKTADFEAAEELVTVCFPFIPQFM